MSTIKGPGIFLAQFVRDKKPYNSVEGLAKWAGNYGYTGVQVPTWDARVFDLQKASGSKDYCDEYGGRLKEIGVEITELASHLQGQVMAIHPAYEVMFQAFYPEGLRDRERVDWASQQLNMSIDASANMGTGCVPAMSGGLAWHMIYPWPQRPQGVVEEAFKELARRWKPILDHAGERGITIGYELHPGSDIYDGVTFEMFLEEVGNHPAACLTYDPSHFVLQQLDYLQFIELYGERIKAFHVKDAEFRPNGRIGVYGGYQSWDRRAGRFRSLGDGQVDFKTIFTLLAAAGYDSWAVLEWECAFKSPEQGAREGAPFIRNHIIELSEVAFDDFADGGSDVTLNRKILGLE
jgi:sugar phosphate isomerase/epimerase